MSAFPPVPDRSIGTTQVTGTDWPPLPVQGRRYFLAGQTAMQHNNEVRNLVSDTIARNDKHTYPSVQKERAGRFN